jgi:enoyl-CoA hydratase
MSQVNYQFANGISTITLDDGKVNALSINMQNALHTALDKAEADGGVMVLCGNQKMFSAGFDLKVFQSGGEELQRMLIGGAELSYRLFSFPTPVVAACTGHAIAMGFFMLLSCDYRIGPNTPAKICANEVEIGLTLPYFAIEICKQKLAPTFLYRTMHLAEGFYGEAAVAAGYLDSAVAPDQVIVTAQEKAQQLSKLNLSAYKATKLRSMADNFDRMKKAMEKDRDAWQGR